MLVTRGFKTHNLRIVEHVRKISNLGGDTEPSDQTPFYGKKFRQSSQNYTKADVKVFWSCSVLLDFFNLSSQFFPWLHFSKIAAL